MCSPPAWLTMHSDCLIQVVRLSMIDLMFCLADTGCLINCVLLTSIGLIFVLGGFMCGITPHRALEGLWIANRCAVIGAHLLLGLQCTLIVLQIVRPNNIDLMVLRWGTRCREHMILKALLGDHLVDALLACKTWSCSIWLHACLSGCLEK